MDQYAAPAAHIWSQTNCPEWKPVKDVRRAAPHMGQLTPGLRGGSETSAASERLSLLTYHCGGYQRIQT